MKGGRLIAPHNKSKYKELKRIRSVIVGGHAKWQQKMKKRLPNFTFIDTDKLNFDSKTFNGIDTIFIFTNYISHGMYKKVINNAHSRGIRIVFLAHTNAELAMEQIYETYMEG